MLRPERGGREPQTRKPGFVRRSGCGFPVAERTGCRGMSCTRPLLPANAGVPVEPVSAEFKRVVADFYVEPGVDDASVAELAVFSDRVLEEDGGLGRVGAARPGVARSACARDPLGGHRWGCR